MAKKTETAVVTPSNNPTIIKVGEQFAVVEAGMEKALASREAVIDSAYTVLQECKTGADWESAVLAFAVGYKGIRKCNEDAATKAAQRIVAAVRQTFDLKKPQSAEAVKKQETRTMKELQNIEASLVSGIGAVEASEKLAKLCTGDNQRTEAKALAAKMATQIASLKAQADKQKQAAKLAEAMLIVAEHYGTNVEFLAKTLSTALAKRIKKTA